MPVFEYKCEECEKIFDVLVKTSDRDQGQKCPHCQSEKVKKLFSTFGIGRNSTSRPCGVPNTTPCGGGCGCGM
ncbi:putative FmdB family regulatory protein [Anaerosolibacter carboniphilus]|uniref:Putative FmdB family regulatory protein n=1 Tax=Anaerosolibacter carboniphilus TaxID=1417629 RepID=A0A841KUE9_9FIRM|nr:zinc ribbon domain-containing protein [Anaerosolibacter carboniphilus]MBB6217246.1 putative FmdB family regulatory protein [Anaerosolibacter carboniphilus]